MTLYYHTHRPLHVPAKHEGLPMHVYAHRGYHLEVPENTLAAFDRALQLGVDGIETDLRLSRDGQVILFHDRLAPGGREVADESRDQLSSAVGYEVPTLQEALDQSADILWILEAKTPAAAEAACDTIERYAGSRRLLLISFWHNVIDRLHQRLPVDCGLLICHRPANVAQLTSTQASGPGRVGTLVWNFEFMDRDALEQAHDCGLRNLVYGVETHQDHQACRLLSVDGLITDRPDWLLNVSQPK